MMFTFTVVTNQDTWFSCHVYPNPQWEWQLQHFPTATMNNPFKESRSLPRMKCNSWQLVENKCATIVSVRGKGLITPDTYKQIRLSNMFCSPGNGLRHLVIEVHCVTPGLLVNELRHMGKWRLNASCSPHVEKKALGKMTAIRLKWDTRQELPAAWATHTNTHTQNRLADK